MNTKLTLTLEKEVIESTKEYARAHGYSLSKLVENYFKLLNKAENSAKRYKLSAKIEKLRGSLNTEQDFDYKKILEAEIFKKHGR